jgi:hypothetical protein
MFHVSIFRICQEIVFTVYVYLSHILELLFCSIFDKFYLHIVLILHLHSTVSIKRWVVAYPFHTFIDLGYNICSTLIKQGKYSKY